MVAKDVRTQEQIYAECNFEAATKSFSDFMQCQMSKKNKLFLPHSVISEPNFSFFGQGKEMYQLSQYFREDLEDSFRH